MEFIFRERIERPDKTVRATAFGSPQWSGSH